MLTKQIYTKHICFLALLLSNVFFMGAAYAFTATVTAGSSTLYLRVGDGAFNGTLNTGGTAQNLSTVNTVSVAMTPAEMITQYTTNSNVNKEMTSNGTIGTSHWDGYTFCNIPQEVYIGGFYRRTSSAGSWGVATLTATVPASLVNERGNTIPFSTISWVSSGNSDGNNTQPFPSRTFAAGNQTLGTIAVNRWAESCHKYTYRHTGFLPSGTYTGRVVYTLTTP